METARPLTDVMAELRKERYAVTLDKLQGLRAFGVRSHRIGRHYYVSTRTESDLRYVLAVERYCELTRDHDGLALELAFRGYPHIPWRRIHAASQKRPARMIANVNRTFHQIASVRGAFTEAACRKLARHLARRYIPDQKLEEDMSNGLARELLEATFEILLNAAYLGRAFEPSSIIRTLQGMGIAEAAARDLSSKLLPFLNENLFPIIQMDPEKNTIKQTVNRAATISEIKATVDTMRSLQRLLPEVLATIRGPAFQLVQNYPEFDKRRNATAYVEFGVHCVFYAVMFGLGNDKNVQNNIARYLTGSAPEIGQALSSLSHVIDMTPQVIRKQYE